MHGGAERRAYVGVTCVNTRLGLAAAAATMLSSSLINDRFNRRAYVKYRDANSTLTLSDDTIVAKARFVQCLCEWPSIERVVDLTTIYALVMINSIICVPCATSHPSGSEISASC